MTDDCVDCPDGPKAEATLDDCQHRTHHRADVDVVYLEDVGGFTADVRIACADCGEKFRFVGVEPGLSGAGPRRSLEGTELHVPLRPASQADTPVPMVGYTVRVNPGGDMRIGFDDGFAAGLARGRAEGRRHD